MIVRLLAALLVVAFVACALGEDPPTGPSHKPTPKKKAPQLDDAVGRAFRRALKESKKNDLLKITRATVAPDASEEDDKVVVIAEFSDGSLGIYAGYCDEHEDTWTVLEKKNVAILDEAVARAKRY